MLLGQPLRGWAGFVTFESGHVRPLALSPDGTRLFAVNTPDNRLAILGGRLGGLTPAAAAPRGVVGGEPPGGHRRDRVRDASAAAGRPAAVRRRRAARPRVRRSGRYARV